MERDPVRQKLKDLLWKRGVTMNAASLTHWEETALICTSISSAAYPRC